MEELRVKWQPKQRKLWNLCESGRVTRLAAGGARGGSKSGWLRRTVLLRRLKYPRSTGLLLRRTMPELITSHLTKLFEEFPHLRQYYTDGNPKMLRLPNGSIQFFVSAPTVKDVAKFYGAEFADIALDEAQEFSQDEMERLGGSNRCTSNADINPIMLFAFMPGVSESGLPPVGLPYLKRVFVDKEWRETETEQTWDFVQAFGWDNVEWARPLIEAEGVTEERYYEWPESRRKEYFLRTQCGKNILSVSDAGLREAWLNGKWDTFESQYFSNWKYERDTYEDTDFEPKPWHHYWISGDWGDYHPACYHLHSQDERGMIRTLREVWVRGANEAEQGRQVGIMCGSFAPTEFVFSWDAFGKLNAETRRPITQMIGEALPPGLPWPVPADASPGSRISGWRLMRGLIDSGGWKIARSCKKLIQCIPTLVRDMKRAPEDVLKVDWSSTCLGDDPADSARYGLQHMAGISQRPKEEIIREHAAEIQDPLARWNYLRANLPAKTPARISPNIKMPWEMGR